MNALSATVTRLTRSLAHRAPINPVKSQLSRAVASLSFDDIPVSAATVGAPILEAAGVRGTFYVCGGHAGGAFEGRKQAGLEHLRALRAAGHEIACHTYAHPDVTRLPVAALDEDIARNAAFLRDALGDERFASFAYPDGAVSIETKIACSRRFLTCRGVYRGVNAGVIDFSDLKAIGVEARQHDMGRVAEHIAEAKAKTGWLIFFTHDVSDDPTPYGCRPQDLKDVIAALQAADIEILPVKAAAARALFGEG